MLSVRKGIKQLILLRIVYYVTDCNFIMGKFNKAPLFPGRRSPQLDCPEPLFLQFLRASASLFEVADCVDMGGHCLFLKRCLMYIRIISVTP